MNALIATVVLAAQLVKLVPEDGISKAFTLRGEGDYETRVSFFRPDVFRVEVGKKVWEDEGTNRTYKVDYSDPKNQPFLAQILLPGYMEDASEVDFADACGKFIFKTSKITVEFDKTTGLMAVADFRGKPILAESQAMEFGMDEVVSNQHVCVQRLKSTPDVRYYGCGQQVGSFQHKGKRMPIDCDYKWDEGGAPNPAPFVMSSEGYGILRHTFSAGAYDFTKADEAEFIHAEDRFDAFYFIGDFAHVLDLYTEATGRPNLIPMWGLELGDADAYMTRENDTKLPKQEADGSFTETTPVVVERVAMRYREEDMPCGWLLVNDGYGCGHIQLASVADKLKQLNFHTGLWTEGKLDRIAWEVGTAGTRVQKLDVAWTSQGGEYKMQHALQCNDDAYRGLTRNANARAFIWTVLGWAGTQRYGICWAGDEYGGWDLIRYMIPTITGSSMSGQAYATTDVDGIFGGSNETFLRDLQWKCWTGPIYVMNGWSHMNKSPWSYPEPYKSLCRDALNLKLRLTPFFYTLMRRAYDTGEPFIVPMVYNFPEDPVTFGDETKYQFMVGRDVLVAPVYTPEKRNRGWWRKGIYLPEGDWYDYNDGRRVAGGQWIKAYPIGLDKLPVFVRAGAILPMYPKCVTTSGSDKSVLTFDIWPASDSRNEFTVYEDDGETLDYRKGAFTRQTVTVETFAKSFGEMGDVKVTIGAAEGGDYAGKPGRRTYELLVHTQVKPMDIPGVLELKSTNGLERALYANARAGWYYEPEEKGGTVHVKVMKEGTYTLRMTEEVVARVASPAYPVPTEAEEAEAAEAVKVNVLDLMKPENKLKYGEGADTVVKAGEVLNFGPLDGTYARIYGHVATHRDNLPEARFTFRISADGKEIFARANMKGSDVPQLIAVDIPGDTHWLKFEFVADDDTEASKAAKGVWQQTEFVTE